MYKFSNAVKLIKILITRPCHICYWYSNNNHSDPLYHNCDIPYNHLCGDWNPKEIKDAIRV